MFWAFNQGKSGAKTLYEKRDEAGDVGKLAHDCIEARIHGGEQPMIPPAYTERVMSSLAAYEKWSQGIGLEIVATEVPLVSEAYRYGGTIDAIGKIAGELCMIDWKTSSAVYSDYLLQLAAYKQLWDENTGPSHYITGGFHLCRFSKEHGDFEHRYWGNLDEAWEMFRYLISAYALDKKIRARCK